MSDRKKLPLMSFSAATCWKSCGERYYRQYIERVRPKEVGASLAFGTAIDVAISFLCSKKKEGKVEEGVRDCKDVFLLDGDTGWEHYFDDLTQKYSKTDYDPDVLTKDSHLISKWEKELQAKVEHVTQEEKVRKNPLNANEEKLYSRVCWLSLKRKGLMMLDAFVLEILPLIKKVIAIQHKIRGKVGDIARIGGYIDLICEFEGYNKPVVFDIKTSASYYDKDKIMFSEQLLLYLNAVGGDLDTNLVGYLVLLKFMKKSSKCSVCGKKKKKGSRYRTCPAEKKGKRCGGTWEVDCKGHSQIMVEEISEERKKQGLNSFANTAKLATQGIRYKDFSRCFDYGLCPYFHLCHYNDESKYIFPKIKEEASHDVQFEGKSPKGE